MIGLWAPTVDSCQLFLQGAHGTSPASADFVRVSNPGGSGDWTWNLSLGNKAVAVSEALHPFPQTRIELSAAQTDTGPSPSSPRYEAMIAAVTGAPSPCGAVPSR